MYKIKIFSIGKTKEAWLREALGEYCRRLAPILSIDWVLSKDNESLIKHLEKEEAYITLEPTGKAYSSESFSSWLIDSLELYGSRINFVIGGAEGLTSKISEKAKAKISLSKMTFTHQLTRLILLEQIYRGLEIQKGSRYHK